MSLLTDLDQGKASTLGEEMHELAASLFPICRSITGAGFRQTLASVRTRIPLDVVEVPSGTHVFDWVVPKEWNIKDAYVLNSAGERVVDFRRSNLHVMNYSAPVQATMPLSELKAHLFTIPDQPDWIPYRTTYYREDWGFCLSHNQLLELKDGDYQVVIDSSLTEGHLTYGECFFPRQST